MGPLSQLIWTISTDRIVLSSYNFQQINLSNHKKLFSFHSSKFILNKMSCNSPESSPLAAPFKCPLSSCTENISSSLLLSHFIKVHQRDDNSVDLKEIQEKEKTSLKISLSDDYLEIDKNVCLGILVFRMDHVKHSNVLLTKQHEFYEKHFPILVMACRGNYVKMMDNEADFFDPDADFLIIWLTMPETSTKKKIFATLTAYNEEQTKSLSTLIRIRNAKDSQNVEDFITTETDYLVINAGFLQEIASDENILVEISIAENFM
jgi:hypothetical protein